MKSIDLNISSATCDHKNPNAKFFTVHFSFIDKIRILFSGFFTHFHIYQYSVKEICNGDHIKHNASWHERGKHYTCSNCGYKVKSKFHYCPDCGFYMRDKVTDSVST